MVSGKNLAASVTGKPLSIGGSRGHNDPENEERHPYDV